MRKVLLKGPNEKELFKIPASSYCNKSHCSKAFMGEYHFAPQWHSSMGHPSFKVINKVLKSLGESISIQNKLKCLDC